MQAIFRILLTVPLLTLFANHPPQKPLELAVFLWITAITMIVIPFEHAPRTSVKMGHMIRIGLVITAWIAMFASGKLGTAHLKYLIILGLQVLYVPIALLSYKLLQAADEKLIKNSYHMGWMINSMYYFIVTFIGAIIVTNFFPLN